MSGAELISLCTRICFMARRETDNSRGPGHKATEEQILKAYFVLIKQSGFNLSHVT